MPESTSERCCVFGCSRPTHARGVCRAHYDRDRRRSLRPVFTPRPITCERCGTVTWARHPLKRFCSERCRVAAEQRRARKRKPPKPTRRIRPQWRLCAQCRAGFVPPSGISRRIFCSKTCQTTARVQRRLDRQRAERFGVPWEPIRRWEVFARDGWLCGFCGGDVDPFLRHPDPGSASLDHIVPCPRAAATSGTTSAAPTSDATPTPPACPPASATPPDSLRQRPWTLSQPSTRSRAWAGPTSRPRVPQKGSPQ